MKLSINMPLFFLPLLLAYSAGAATTCDVQVSRSETPAVCAHFEGINADPYYQWYDELKVQSRYTGMVYLLGSDASKPENGAAIHWKVDEEYVHLAMAVRATGWLGFGMAETGGMIGADMALFEALKPDEITDAYTTDTRFPVTDDCPSNWELVSSHIDEEGGFMMVEFKRLLDTNDPQDKPIFNDTSTLVPQHRVIAAWGDSAEVGYHGMNRARGSIRFHGTGDDEAMFASDMAENAEGSFMVASFNHEIPAMETEYAYTCVNYDDLIDQGVMNTTDLLNIIGFEPIIQDGNEAYVHHYILSGYQTPECPTDKSLAELVYAWAPGAGGFSLPDDLGTPLFGNDGFKSFEIEVHYDNPQLTEGVIDNSGVRLYWTSQPRDQQIGMLTVGDPGVALSGKPVGDGFAMHSFECPGTCSALVGQPVTILQESLHMHQSGTRIINQHIRDGKVIREAILDYWEFDQSGNTMIQQAPYVVEPGDGFKTSCYYNGKGKIFGLASSEEMCMAFLYYYPRVKFQIDETNLELPWVCGYDLGFTPCETTYETKKNLTSDELGRYFGTSKKDKCDDDSEVPMQDNSGTSRSPLGWKGVFIMFLAFMTLM